MAFNVKKNWPLGGALEDSAKPKAGEGIVAGMAVSLDASRELVKSTGGSKEVSFMALDNQDALDVVEADKLPYVIGNAIVQTDQFVADTYAINDELQVSVTGGEEGLLKKHLGAGAPTWGWVEALVTQDGVAMLSIIKPIPMGEAQ